MTRLQKMLNARVDRAIWEYGMIKPRDRVLIAVSGGADSMALLDILRLRIEVFGNDIRFFATYIDLGFGKNSQIRCEQIRSVLRRNQIKGTVIESDIGFYAHSKENRENPCFLCSRLRRKRIFETAEELGCNKIAFGHNKDDIIETLLLNMIWGREISTMSPNLAVFAGKYNVIRPLMYIEENLLKKYCWERNLSTFSNDCPTAGNSKRRYIKELLNQLESDHKGTKENIFNSMKRVKQDYLL
jgi:tRNA 2-thiocytidine biosynthesis protein TtcA